MAPSRSQPSWLSTVFAILTILTFSSPAHAVYLYFERRQPKCFYEELPQDTLVVANYHADVYSPKTRTYVADSTLNIGITVEETFDNDHRVVNQRGGNSGRLTFSAADAGQHKICFIPDISGGWFSNGASGTVKLTLDIAIGETSKIETEDKSKMDTMVQKVQDLNSRLQDIRREQVFQREREAEFRDQSEATNARVVRWALIQLLVLTITCAWQLSHLRSFFIKQKLT